MLIKLLGFWLLKQQYLVKVSTNFIISLADDGDLGS